MSRTQVSKQLHAASPMLISRQFGVIRTCLLIDQGTWVVAEISLDKKTPYFCQRLPSGCLIERISDDESKVTWVEHTEVAASLPDQTSAFAFGAERMAAWLQRYCERTSLMNATYSHSLETQGTGTYFLIDMHLSIYLSTILMFHNSMHVHMFDEMKIS